MGETYSTHGNDDVCIQILVQKPEEKRPLGRPRRRWEDKIRMAVKEIGWQVVGWMHMAQD
jgi:hypothetical protein